jgi:hypothetical protein
MVSLRGRLLPLSNACKAVKSLRFMLRAFRDGLSYIAEKVIKGTLLRNCTPLFQPNSQLKGQSNLCRFATNIDPP